MPKKPGARKPPNRKTREPASEDEALLEALQALDQGALERLRDTLLGGDESDDDILEMFDEFIDRLRNFDARDLVDTEDFIDDVVVSLTQLAIDDNGGFANARELRAAIYERLDDCLRGDRLDAAGLVLVAKVLNDSGWRVPDRLKTTLVEMLESGGAAGSGAGELKSALADIAGAAADDPFAAYQALNSVLSAFPSETAAKMVATLGESDAGVLLQTLAGFAMHGDRLVSAAAIQELRNAAKGAPVESALVERLVRMRPWLPDDRHPPLDDAIRALRANARAPVEPDRPSAVRCFVTACDGSGAGGALATFKSKDGWGFLAAMTKPTGVEEVLSLEGLGKRQADATLRGMRENVTAAQTDPAGLARYLQLALGENLTARNPPPFKLIALAESLGLGPIAPRILSPAELIADVLADAPETHSDAAAVARAREAVLGGALEQSWFEAGEAVESLIGPIRSHKARARALLTAYLPGRRDFWARACAMTAFVLNLDRKAYGGLGHNLALVGREIVEGAAMEAIPLMRQIADATIHAYQDRR